jgi:hypothetical protein
VKNAHTSPLPPGIQVIRAQAGVGREKLAGHKDLE